MIHEKKVSLGVIYLIYNALSLCYVTKTGEATVEEFSARPLNRLYNSEQRAPLPLPLQMYLCGFYSISYGVRAGMKINFQIVR